MDSVKSRKCCNQKSCMSAKDTVLNWEGVCWCTALTKNTQTPSVYFNDLFGSQIPFPEHGHLCC